jgi:hypothetical protein
VAASGSRASRKPLAHLDESRETEDVLIAFVDGTIGAVPAEAAPKPLTGRRLDGRLHPAR